MRNIFISYHHLREQEEKDKLAQLINNYTEILNVKDRSVTLGDINPSWPDKKIAKTIREKFLKDTTITILILGTHTKCRQHINWEIFASSMRYGSLNRRNKINSLIILLTSDFIKENKNNPVTDYRDLITKENAGEIIAAIVENDYAIVNSFDEVFLNTAKLKKIIDEADNKKNNPIILYKLVIKAHKIASEETSQQVIITNNKNDETTLKKSFIETNKIIFFLKNISIQHIMRLRRESNSEVCPPKNIENKTNFSFDNKNTFKNDFKSHKFILYQQQRWKDLTKEPTTNIKLKKSKSIIGL